MLRSEDFFPFGCLLADAGSSENVTEKTPIPPPDWEALIAQIADEIVAERSPARLSQVRAKLYDLLTHCIPPTTILKVSHDLNPLCTQSLFLPLILSQDSYVQVNTKGR
jgi:hypothetical protein